MTQNKGSISLWRGALGGVLGSVAKYAFIWFIFTLVYPKRIGYFDNTTTVLSFVVLSAPSAAVMGVIIAAIIRAISLKTESRIGIIGRAVTGACILFAFWAVIVLYDKYFPEMNRWSLDNAITWMIAPIFKADAGLFVGAVAGLFAARKQKGIDEDFYFDT